MQQLIGMSTKEPSKINEVVLPPLPPLENAASTPSGANSIEVASTLPTSVTTTLAVAALAASTASASAATTSARGSNAYWLYWQCKGGVEKMESSKNLLELVLIVLKVVREIENGGEHNPDKNGMSIVEEQCFFNVFNGDVVKQSNTEFILSLAEKSTDTIEDDTLNNIH